MKANFINRPEIFWIKFAGLYCRVTAMVGMRAIITKYFSGSYCTISSRGPKALAAIAELNIQQKPKKINMSSIVVSKKQLRYSVVMNGSPHFYYPLLSNILQRIFMALFYENEGIIFHASAVEYQGKAHVFVGESGRGKTTIARISSHLYNLRVLADNQIFIRKKGNEYVLYPFPISQYHTQGDSAYLRLAPFYVLHKHPSFKVMSMTFIETMHALEREIQILSADEFDQEIIKCPPGVRKTVFDFAKSVQMRRLYFLPKKGIWEVIHGSQ